MSPCFTHMAVYVLPNAEEEELADQLFAVECFFLIRYKGPVAEYLNKSFVL